MPNEYGGRENLEAIEFLRNTNRVLGEQTPERVTMAEEVHRLRRFTTVFDGPVLTFGFPNGTFGWMHDTLDYMQLDPIYRRYHVADKMTFDALQLHRTILRCRCHTMKWFTAKNRFLTGCPALQQDSPAPTTAGCLPSVKAAVYGQQVCQGGKWNHDASLVASAGRATTGITGAASGAAIRNHTYHTP